MSPYSIWVKRVGFFSLWRKYTVTGHGLSDQVTDFVMPKDGKKPVPMSRPAGTLRLELWLKSGGVIIFCDASKVQFRLGNEWVARKAEEVENDSGEAVKLAK